jgi:hypothetical protein
MEEDPESEGQEADRTTAAHTSISAPVKTLAAVMPGSDDGLD